MQTLALLRILAACVMLGWGLLAVFRMPTGKLFYPAVVATEGSYLLALLALPAFAGGLGTPLDIALSALGTATLVLLISPLVRVRGVARQLPAGLVAAFGESEVTRSAELPFRYGRLALLRDPEVPRETIPYGQRPDGTPLLLDLYGGTHAARPRPLVLIVHGGSWCRGDRHQLPGIAKHLAHEGYVVASMDYSLAPAHRFPAAFDDVRAALDFLRERAQELGIDPDRVVLYGRSAGGHLALLTAYRLAAPYVRGVVGLYPPADLVYSWEHPSNPRVFDTHGTLRAFMGGAPHEGPELRSLYHDASPYAWASSGSPPTLLVHGGRDELVSRAQSERLAARLGELGVPHFFLALPWATHGCEANLAGPSGQLTRYALRHFLARVFVADTAPRAER